MAVYTVLNRQDIQHILTNYAMGDLIKFEPISSGIENTNYFIWTQKHAEQASTEKYVPIESVLTIFENINQDSLPFFNQLTAYLFAEGVFVPAPVLDIKGDSVFTFVHENTEKFGVIVPKFKGASLNKPDVSDCQAVGAYLANMHVILEKCALRREIEHSPAWCEDLLEKLKPHLSPKEKQLLDLALLRYLNYQNDIERCPKGIVHGDLFRDNVLFDDGKVSGLIDFYHAGNTAFLFDLAVIANDWTVNFEQLPPLFSETNTDASAPSDSHTIFDKQKLNALIASYNAVKPMSEIERKVWPRLLELAAFRFCLSRLKTKYLDGYQKNVKQGEVVKSPVLMMLILMATMQMV